MRTHHIQWLHYVTLAIILGSGVFFLVTFRGSPTMQIAAGISTTVGYVLWGIIHHMIQKDLHKRIVIEYVLIGVVAVMVIATVIGG